MPDMLQPNEDFLLQLFRYDVFYSLHHITGTLDNRPFVVKERKPSRLWSSFNTIYFRLDCCVHIPSYIAVHFTNTKSPFSLSSITSPVISTTSHFSGLYPAFRQAKKRVSAVSIATSFVPIFAIL